MNTSELLKDNKQVQILYFIVAAVLLLAVILISSLLSREITKPIRQLRDSMSMVEEGEFEKANVDITTENEIGSLSKSFNVMTERIHTLMDQNVYEQKQKRKIELRALQAQINPHFLYNTLDSIIWMSEAGRNEEVVEMTSALARLLRQSISNDQELVAVEKEIDYVRSYLTIQKMRYQDKLEYSIDIDPEIRFVEIVKLTLQPLVENAVKHGVGMKEGGGTVTIATKEFDDRYEVIVSDDGVGFDTAKKPNDRRTHIGMENVRNRLKTMCNAVLNIESTVGKGTVATITIPKEEN